MDDIDDLLNEVETKFCLESSSDCVKKKPSKPRFSEPSNNKMDSLDEIINDIIADDGLKDVLKRNRSDSALSTNSLNNSSSSKLKCFTVYVGGSLSNFDATTGTHQNSCNRLHCTSCDNKIVSFDDFKWSDAGCEYLVFRNNYPDFSRLKSILVPRKGYRSYCCQCSWLSTKSLLELRSCEPTFKWNDV